MKKPRKLTQPSELYGVGPAAASLPLVLAYNDARKQEMLQARKPPAGWGAAACCPMVCRK